MALRQGCYMIPRQCCYGNPVMAPGHGCYGTLQGCCGTCACAH